MLAAGEMDPTCPGKCGDPEDRGGPEVAFGLRRHNQSSFVPRNNDEISKASSGSRCGDSDDCDCNDDSDNPAADEMKPASCGGGKGGALHGPAKTYWLRDVSRVSRPAMGSSERRDSSRTDGVQSEKLEWQQQQSEEAADPSRGFGSTNNGTCPISADCLLADSTELDPLQEIQHCPWPSSITVGAAVTREGASVPLKGLSGTVQKSEFELPDESGSVPADGVEGAFGAPPALFQPRHPAQLLSSSSGQLLPLIRPLSSVLLQQQEANSAKQQQPQDIVETQRRAVMETAVAPVVAGAAASSDGPVSCKKVELSDAIVQLAGGANGALSKTRLDDPEGIDAPAEVASYWNWRGASNGRERLGATLVPDWKTTGSSSKMVGQRTAAAPPGSPNATLVDHHSHVKPVLRHVEPAWAQNRRAIVHLRSSGETASAPPPPPVTNSPEPAGYLNYRDRNKIGSTASSLPAAENDSARELLGSAAGEIRGVPKCPASSFAASASTASLAPPVGGAALLGAVTGMDPRLVAAAGGSDWALAAAAVAAGAAYNQYLPFLLAQRHQHHEALLFQQHRYLASLMMLLSANGTVVQDNASLIQPQQPCAPVDSPRYTQASLQEPLAARVAETASVARRSDAADESSPRPASAAHTLEPSSSNFMAGGDNCGNAASGPQWPLGTPKKILELAGGVESLSGLDSFLQHPTFNRYADGIVNGHAAAAALAAAAAAAASISSAIARDSNPAASISSAIARDSNPAASISSAIPRDSNPAASKPSGGWLDSFDQPSRRAPGSSAFGTSGARSVPPPPPVTFPRHQENSARGTNEQQSSKAAAAVLLNSAIAAAAATAAKAGAVAAGNALQPVGRLAQETMEMRQSPSCASWKPNGGATPPLIPTDTAAVQKSSFEVPVVVDAYQHLITLAQQQQLLLPEEQYLRALRLLGVQQRDGSTPATRDGEGESRGGGSCGGNRLGTLEAKVLGTEVAENADRSIDWDHRDGNGEAPNSEVAYKAIAGGPTRGSADRNISSLNLPKTYQGTTQRVNAFPSESRGSCSAPATPAPLRMPLSGRHPITGGAIPTAPHSPKAASCLSNSTASSASSSAASFLNSIASPATPAPLGAEPAESTIATQFFRTKMCPWFPERRCRMGDRCNWAHSDAELRPSVDLTNTKLCENLFKRGRCDKPRCRFAHSREDLRATTDVYKTSVCVFWERGGCAAGARCRYAHGEQELRRKMDTSVASAVLTLSDVVGGDSSEQLDISAAEGSGAGANLSPPKAARPIGAALSRMASPSLTGGFPAEISSVSESFVKQHQIHEQQHLHRGFVPGAGQLQTRHQRSQQSQMAKEMLFPAAELGYPPTVASRGSDDQLATHAARTNMLARTFGAGRIATSGGDLSRPGSNTSSICDPSETAAASAFDSMAVASVPAVGVLQSGLSMLQSCSQTGLPVVAPPRDFVSLDADRSSTSPASMHADSAQCERGGFAASDAFTVNDKSSNADFVALLQDLRYRQQQTQHQQRQLIYALQRQQQEQQEQQATAPIRSFQHGGDLLDSGAGRVQFREPAWSSSTDNVAASVLPAAVASSDIYGIDVQQMLPFFSSSTLSGGEHRIVPTPGAVHQDRRPLGNEVAPLSSSARSLLESARPFPTANNTDHSGLEKLR